MKQKLLFKTMLLLLCMIVGGSSAWADDETVTFPTTTSNTTLTLPYEVDGTTDVTVTINKNSGTSAATNTDGLRVYAGSTIQFSSSSKKIESIVFTYKRNKKQTNGVTANTGSFTTEFTVGNSTASNLSATWEADDKNTSSVTFTLGSGGGNYALQSALVTFVDGGSSPTTYVVYFDAGAGTFVGNEDFPDEDNTVEAGTYTLPTPTAADGYTFDGWVPSGGTGLFTGSYEVTEDVYFEAQYSSSTAPSCTIDPTSYNFGNVAIGTPATKTFTVTTANLTGDVTLFIHSGDEDEFTISPTTIAQNATSTEVTVTFTPTSANDFYILLKANGGGITNHDLANIYGTGAQSYTVTFNPGNGTCATASTTELVGTEIDLPTATPNAVCTEAGWTFAGWATASVASGSTTATLVPSKYTVTENITLYAVYQLTNENGATTTFNFAEIAETNDGWTNGTAHTTVEISPITLKANGGGNNGKFYTSDATWRMYNGGSVSITSAAGAITSVTSNPSTTFTISNGSASQSFTATTMFKSITVNYATATFASSPVAAVATPTISGTTPFYGTNEVTITCGTDGATILYSTDDGANWNTYTAPFNINATTTVKAKATKTDWTDSEVAEKTFTAIAPLTVTEALTAIDALENNGQITEQYVKGYVSTTGSLSSGKITYSISVDGSATNELKIYKGKGLNDANFTAASDIALGDEVVVYGTLQKYYANSTTTPEFIEGNYLFNKVRHPAPEFTLDPTSKTLDAYTHETVDITVTTNTDGIITCESSDEDVATVAQKSAGVYTITAQTEGTATITIKSAVSENYAPASATVEITVEDERTDAGISFAKDTEETTWGEEFTGLVLTNTNGVDVVWSSTDETVATVNASGVVTVLKAGETDIKATFAGNATYKAAVVSYTLTVNKAAAGLSYATTSYDIMLDDASFVAPTLNNPNGLTVTYASDNTDVAVVDENTGELAYDETAAGTAKITATFAGNDWYKSGSASYTINIIDPSVKGTKYNPYTVAEVIDGTATGSGIYVTGYIVGEYRNANQSTTTVLTSSFTTDANIAIADDPTTTALASSIPVNLTKSADQKAFGNKSNNGKTIGYKVLVKGDALKYFGMPGFKNIDEISAVSVPATLNASGYATFASTYPLDFTDDSEFSAWQITEISGNAITFYQITGTVKAGTGVLIKGTASSNINIPVAASGTDISATNKLTGITTATAIEADTYYGLSGNKFVKVNAGTVPAGKALLPASAITNAARELTFVFEGETTGIADVRGQKADVRGDIFDLQGRKVAQPKKGLYIMNGKKVIMK